MDYKFLESSVDIEDVTLPESDKINPFLLKNNYAEVIKAVDFLNSKDTFLYVHGFMGTGKRQFINYVSEFLNSDVIKLEYYCKSSTVCDDILLRFINTIENYKVSKTANINIKITTLAVKFQQYISSLQKPFIIILHSFDDISEENRALVVSCFTQAARLENTKIIVSTRAMVPDILGELKVERRFF
jgi:Cdc6-like AAA superfamily ATPase